MGPINKTSNGITSTPPFASHVTQTAVQTVADGSGSAVWACFTVTPTFVVERAVKVVAARVEACGELDEVPGPGVAGAGEAGQGLQQLGARGQEAAVHAAVV